MNTRRLEVFVTIYKSGSITIAAERLNLTKSAVSQTLSAFEQEVKTPLFVRESRKLIPTQMANNLYAHLSPLLESIFQVYRAVTAESAEMAGTISIGAPPDMASKYIIPCLSELSEKYPGLKYILQLGTPFTLGDLLVKNQLDIGIMDASDVFEKMYPISVRPLSVEAQVLVASREYIKARMITDYNYEAFCGEKFVSHRTDLMDVKFWCKHHFKKVPRNIEVSLVVDQVPALKAAVLSHFGWGYLPERLVIDELKHRSLVEWPTLKPKYQNKIGLAQLSGKKPSKLEKLVVNFIFDYFARNRLKSI